MKSFIDTSSKVINEGVQQVKQFVSSPSSSFLVDRGFPRTIATNIPTTHPSGAPHHFEVDISYITAKLIGNKAKKFTGEFSIRMVFLSDVDAAR